MNKLLYAVTGSALLSASASAAVIDFTGGDVFLNNGSYAGITNNSTSNLDVAYYVEDGFVFEFFFDVPTPDAFASIVGDYYATGNDVAHWHWSGGGFGEVSEVRVSKLDGTAFDLGGFSVSTNTSNGGGAATGGELVSINTSKASNIFNVDSDDWGLGAGPDPLITIDPLNALFDDIFWFSFTNDDFSTAVGMGLDNIFIDEAGDPGGDDPTPPAVPLPAGAWLFLSALGGLAGIRYKQK